MPYKRKYKSVGDLAKSVSKKSGYDRELCSSITAIYIKKIKEAVMADNKISLNEFGTFEITKWKAQGIYNINTGLKVDREIKTILFRPSPNLKKKIAD